MKIGVIGAGFIGRALARVAVRNGHEVMISNSRGPESLLSTGVALRSKIGTVAEAAAFGDVVILAIPLAAIGQLDPRDFEGRIVLDANNYYPQRDGAIPALDTHEATTSGLLQQQLPGARVVKFFNAILQEDIEKDAKPRGTPGRRALPLAADDAGAKRIAADLIDQFGFDPVDAGSLADSWRFERAMPAYCMPLTSAQLRQALAAAERGVEVPLGSWRSTAPAPAETGVAMSKGPHHGFAGRGSWDIVDAQFHLQLDHNITASLAAMDALGIRSAVVDEFWDFDAHQLPRPYARLPDGSARPLTVYGQAAALEHPSRFAYIQRVVRTDPQLAQLIPVLATTPGCLALRASLLTADERQRFADGGWDDVLSLAQQHGLPICVMAPDQAGPVVTAVARRFNGLQIVVDHCGWPRTPQHWEDVLQLAKLPNTVLKWSHFHRAFRRFDDPKAALQREFLRAVDAFGTDRVMWAGDTSHEESSATWGELLGFVRDNQGLSEGDRAAILGRTARRVFGWPA